MEKLDSILRDHVAKSTETKDKLLGASFFVVNKNGVLYSGSAGRIGMDTSSPTWSIDSFTYVASLTKLVTITAIMQLVEQGRMNLHDDMRETVPQLAAMQILKGFDGDKPILEDNVKPITLWNLLTHTTGLGYDAPDPDLQKWAKAVGRTANCNDWTLDGFTTPIKFPAGEGWYYGTAIDWACQALEKVTGQPLSTYVQAHIFDPLGMKDSTWWPAKLPHVVDHKVQMTYRQDDGTLQAGPYPFPMDHSMESGGSGLLTTAKDYATFMQAFLAGKLLKGETMDLMFTPQLDEHQEKMLNEVGDEFHEGFKPEFPKGLGIQHGIGGIINMEDCPEKRTKGSMSWSGFLNSRWWIDRSKGIGAAQVLCLLPFGDAVANDLWDQLERAVYSDLLTS